MLVYLYVHPEHLAACKGTSARHARRASHAGAELGSRVRGGEGGVKFPGPSKLTTGGGANGIFFENHFKGQYFQIRGAK